jgi:hypothetical protein
MTQDKRSSVKDEIAGNAGIVKNFTMKQMDV